VVSPSPSYCSLSGVSAINPLVAFYNIHGGKRGAILLFCPGHHTRPTSLYARGDKKDESDILRGVHILPKGLNYREITNAWQIVSPSVPNSLSSRGVDWFSDLIGSAD
jgi:hypothetical protein